MIDAELEKLADALTRDHRDGSWCMNPKGAFLKGYDEGYKKAREWISVKERLPEVNKRVLILDGTMDVALFDGKFFIDYLGDQVLPDYWQELPAKPEGVE